MSRYQFNVNNFSIEKDERFFAYVNIINANQIVKLLNEQEETIERLKTIREEQIEVILKQKEKIKELEVRNKRQYERLEEITDLMMKRDWDSLEKIVEDWEQAEELLQAEWGIYGDVE